VTYSARDDAEDFGRGGYARSRGILVMALAGVVTAGVVLAALVAGQRQLLARRKGASGRAATAWAYGFVLR